jgi:hypothetical protein
LALILQYVVVIGSIQAPRPAELLDKLRELEVITIEVSTQSVVQVAPVYEYRHPVFHKFLHQPLLEKYYEANNTQF